MPEAVRPWTDEEIETTRRLYVDDRVSAGKTAGELNTRFHGGEPIRSKNSVLGLSHRQKWDTGRVLTLATDARVPSTPKPKATTRLAGAPYIAARVEKLTSEEEKAKPAVAAGLAALARMDDESRDAATLVGFFQLKSWHCRWPVRGEGIETLFCGEVPVTGKPYCTAHCARAWAQPRTTRE
jgi:hypothetical protein